MHPNNLHKAGYDFELLSASYPELTKYIILNPSGQRSIDFGDYQAVKTFNQALLKTHYHINSTQIPDPFLIPPVPGRVDYIHHIAEIVEMTDASILDIGTGASLIYPLLGATIFDWKFKAVDVSEEAVQIARKQLLANPSLKNHITIQLQSDRGSIYKNIICDGDYFAATMCNPPFYSSEKEALKANAQKNQNLGISSTARNFQGVSHELWCNGGEALFIKRMIKESVLFKSQVGWFTTLVSQSGHLPKIYKQLDKLGASHKTIDLTQGQKKSRIVAWQFV